MVRFKNRYLLCTFYWQDRKVDPRIKNADIYNCVKESIRMNFGDYGSGLLNSSLSVKYWNPVTGLAIIRATRDHFRMLWFALTMITHINSRMVKIKVVHTGGTIRTCAKKVIAFITSWIADPVNKIEKFRRESQGAEMMSEIRDINA